MLKPGTKAQPLGSNKWLKLALSAAGLLATIAIFAYLLIYTKK